MNIDAGAWSSTVADRAADGFAYLDLLTAVDRPADGTIEIVLILLRPDDAAACTLTTSIGRAEPRLASLVTLFPSASWHEREIREMFGVEFDGNPDSRPLLLSSGLGIHPLRKDTVLVSRAVTPWPGAPDRSGSAAPPGAQDDEPTSSGRRSRRASLPPGVPADWLREEGS